MTQLDPFLRTSAGLLAARVDDLAWLAVPVESGIRIAGTWRLAKPPADWTPDDFHSSEGIVADEAGFREHVGAIAEHRRQLPALGRQSIDARIDTPWGWPDHCTRYAEGIISYTTPSHGGFHVDDTRRAMMHAALRNAEGWYEEDEQWAKVAMAFPDLFTTYEREQAEKTLRNWEPDIWEALHGRKLDPSESFVRDRQHFEAIHANDWVVMSASRSREHPGQVECGAALGGRRDTTQRRLFLVPSDEYRMGRHGFVIDESRHPQI